MGGFGVPILFIFYGCICFLRLADEIGTSWLDAYFGRIAAAFHTAFVHRHCRLAIPSVALADAWLVGRDCGIINVFRAFPSIFYVSEQNWAAKINYERLECLDFERRGGVAHGIG